VRARAAGGGPPVPAADDLLGAVRACYGVLLIGMPRQLAGCCLRCPATPRELAVIRVLGVRHLLQAMLTPASAPGLRAGAAVDTVHAASMAGLGLIRPRLRRAVLADAALEAGLAAFGMMTARFRLAGSGKTCGTPA
jgi:hypothetical protein